MSSLNSDSTPSSIQNISRSSFIPNFVLVSSDQARSTIILLEDSLGFQKTLEVAYNLIQDSQDRLTYILQQSKILLICTLSLVKEVLTNALYQSYLAITWAIETTLDWSDYNPVFGRQLQRETAKIESVAGQNSFWWVKSNSWTAKILEKSLSVLISIISLLQKAYLVILIFASLGILQLVSSLAQSPTTPGSFISKFVQNNTLPTNLTIQTKIGLNNDIKLEAQTAVLDTPTQPSIQKILSYEAKPGDNLDKIANNFGVLSDTIIFNNNITELEVGKKIYIPWTDGYIYNASEEISIDDLTRIYKTDKESLLKYNQAVMDPSKNTFQKDSLVLIPTSDFKQVEQNNNQEKDRIGSLVREKQQAEEDAKIQAEQKIKQEEEARSQRRQAIARAAVEVSVSTTPSSIASFIWPSNGRISRCNIPGHIACDITNNVGTPIVVAASGTVVEAGWKNGGFGNMILIDHGNGLRTIYMHMSQVTVAAGQVVNSGELIGLMGNTGNSTGSHLHFGVFNNGREVNPLQYLP